MGAYTGLRCKVIIKKEYIKDIEELLRVQSWCKCHNAIFKKFGEKNDRADFIPYGSLSYMPGCWEDSNDKQDIDFIEYIACDGFNNVFYPQTGLWCFQCSLKNYNNDIGKFIDNILTVIVEKIIHLEKLYEENIISTLYNFDENNKIIPLNYGIRYEEDDDVWCFVTPIKDNNMEWIGYDYTKERRFRIGESIN